MSNSNSSMKTRPKPNVREKYDLLPFTVRKKKRKTRLRPIVTENIREYKPGRQLVCVTRENLTDNYAPRVIVEEKKKEIGASSTDQGKGVEEGSEASIDYEYLAEVLRNAPPYEWRTHDTTKITPEADEYNRQCWTQYAEAALVHYNAQQSTRYKLEELKGNWCDINFELTVHLNFTAKSEDEPDAPPNLFYAESKGTFMGPTRVTGCCVMKKISEGDPRAGSCPICDDHLLHPAARYGYLVASGDKVGDYFKPRAIHLI